MQKFTFRKPLKMIMLVCALCVISQGALAAMGGGMGMGGGGMGGGGMGGGGGGGTIDPPMGAVFKDPVTITNVSTSPALWK